MNPNDKDRPDSGFEQLAEQGRVRDFRMSKDGHYTAEQTAKLRQELLDYKNGKRDRRGKALSWGKLGDRVGEGGSGPTLNAWCYGKYDGDTDAVASRVDLFLADERDRAGRLRLGYCSIGNAKLALAVINAGVRQNSICAVIGPSGCGKTMLARAVAAERTSALLVTVDQHSGSRAGVTRLLFAAIGAPGRGVTSGERWRAWTEYVGVNRNTVLLVDECQNLRRDGLETLRDAHDLSDPGGERCLPIVLLGDSRFYRLLAESRAGRPSPIAPQLSRRIYPCFDYETDGRVDDGSGDLYSVEDIALVVGNDRVRLVDGDGLRWLARLSNLAGWGRLGHAVAVLKLAYDFDKRAPLGVAALGKALNMLFGRSVAAEIDVQAGGELLRKVAS